MAYAHYFGGFFNGKTTEKLKFNDTTLLWINARQFFQRLVQCQQIDRRLAGKLFRSELPRTRNRESLLIRTTAFGGPVLARVVH